VDGETLNLIMAIDLENIPPKARYAVGAMAILASTMTTVGLYEGFKDTAYIPVPGDVPTIGFGSTRHENGKPVKLGDKVSAPQALRMLNVDLEGNIATPLKKCIEVPLFDYEWSAYIQLAYNIGPYAFCGSTLVKKLNRLDYAGACAEISRWNKKGGKVLAGLTNRREKERAICEGKKPEG
jgi:lysozyme